MNEQTLSNQAIGVADVAVGSAVAERPLGLRVCMHVLGMGRIDGRVIRAASALTRAGCAVTVVDIEHDDSRPQTEEIDGIRYKHTFMSSRWRRYYQPVSFLPWMAFKVLRILKGVAGVVMTPADVYHAHDVTALPACYLAARLRRKVLVYDAHELPLVDPQHTRHRLIWLLSTRWVKRMLRRCATVITVSPFLIDELRTRYGGPTATLIRNIPPYQPPLTSNRLRERLGLGADSAIALYQGNIQDDRGLDILVRAARYIAPRHRIVLMGRDLAQGSIQAMVAQEGVGDRVTILPPVPSDELLEWTSSADLGLIVYRPSQSPNVRYCLPNKIFEYIMAGVPVLASPLDAVAQLLHRYDAGAVLPSVDPEQVGPAIGAMLDDAAALTRMRHNATIAAERELNWEQESGKLVQLYQELQRRITSRQRR